MKQTVLKNIGLNVEAVINAPNEKGSRALYMREYLGDVKNDKGEVVAEVCTAIGRAAFVISLNGLDAYYIDLSPAIEEVVRQATAMYEAADAENAKTEGK